MSRNTRENFGRKVRAFGGSFRSAQALGVSRSYVDMIIKGDRRPGMRTAHAIERTFGIAMQAWVSEPEPTEPAAGAPSP